jgi:hypothetical protein
MTPGDLSALPATGMFLRDNRNDSDFSAFLSIWHSLSSLSGRTFSTVQELGRYRKSLAAEVA